MRLVQATIEIGDFPGSLDDEYRSKQQGKLQASKEEKSPSVLLL